MKGNVAISILSERVTCDCGDAVEGLRYKKINVAFPFFFLKLYLYKVNGFHIFHDACFSGRIAYDCDKVENMVDTRNISQYFPFCVNFIYLYEVDKFLYIS